MWPRLQLGGICPHIANVVYLKQRTEQNREHIWPSCSLDMALINFCRRPYYAKRTSVNNCIGCGLIQGICKNI
jgi:hypothetical protein